MAGIDRRGYTNWKSDACTALHNCAEPSASHVRPFWPALNIPSATTSAGLIFGIVLVAWNVLATSPFFMTRESVAPLAVSCQTRSVHPD